jgi:DNA-binding NarL/FixJ family response regulator
VGGSTGTIPTAAVVSAREQQLAVLLALVLSNPEIARELVVCLHTASRLRTS